MKHLCFSKLFLLFLLFGLSINAQILNKSAAVYYADDISYANLGIHDYIIVESDSISPYTHGFKTYKKKMYAYVSIGEASSYRGYFKDLKEEWKISENKSWDSIVMDISNDEYHAFMYEKVIDPLIDKGYENFFFDTLDSYQLAVKNDNDKKEYELGLIRFIKKFKLRYPKSKLIVNRGFEVMDEIHESLEAVLFESLFYGLSAKGLNYAQVNEEDRNWLLSQVEKIKAYGLDVISVDYMDIRDEAKIKKTIKQIESLGIIPYISNKELTRYGVSSKNALKREVLIMYNIEDDPYYSYAHQLASLPLEYMGYSPILKDINKDLPTLEEMSRFKAVIIWIHSEIKDKTAYERWVESLVLSGHKILFMDGFGLGEDTKLCKILGIKKNINKAGTVTDQRVAYKDQILEYETSLQLAYHDSFYQPKKSKNYLVVENSFSQKNVTMAKTEWGGYALAQTHISKFGEDLLWVVNPFEFFRQTLELENIPVPDTTTQNGRRLLFVHVDGDGSMNKVEWNPKKYSIEVMYQKILKKYPIPQSISIIEAELSSKGLYPKDAEQLEDIARNIYNLPYVEAATHTYTHPFDWEKINNDDLDDRYRLKVENYNFSIDREIKGSLNYINETLLKKTKSKANTVYWTGNCLPQKEVLLYTYKNNILNINGGYTTITNDKPWLSLVTPLGFKRDEYYQVYTGAQNENVYTNDWHGPFWGYKKVIQTFELTDKPRRLKPIDIYYHTYAASKIASLNALDNVYKWALSQENMPIFTSEYIPKVLEFYDLSMSKTDKGWHFEGMKELKTVRLNTSDAKIDYKNSQAVIGHKRDNDQTYVHLNTQAASLDLDLGKTADENYLIDTNAEVLSYQRSMKEISFKLKGHVNLILNYHLKDGCKLEVNTKPFSKKKNGSKISMIFKVKEADVLIRCQ